MGEYDSLPAAVLDEIERDVARYRETRLKAALKRASIRRPTFDEAVEGLRAYVGGGEYKLLPAVRLKRAMQAVIPEAFERDWSAARGGRQAAKIQLGYLTEFPEKIGEMRAQFDVRSAMGLKSLYPGPK